MEAEAVGVADRSLRHWRGYVRPLRNSLVILACVTLFGCSAHVGSSGTSVRAGTARDAAHGLVVGAGYAAEPEEGDTLDFWWPSKPDPRGSTCEIPRPLPGDLPATIFVEEKEWLSVSGVYRLCATSEPPEDADRKSAARIAGITDQYGLLSGYSSSIYLRVLEGLEREKKPVPRIAGGGPVMYQNPRLKAELLRSCSETMPEVGVVDVYIDWSVGCVLYY